MNAAVGEVARREDRAPPRRNRVYGLMAEFTDHDALLAAAASAFAEGYKRIDAYSPFPITGLAEAIGRPRTIIPLLVLLGGAAGGVGGYFMQWYSMAVDYPLDVGGRPLHSWPAFVPITFELTVLCAALTAFFSVFLLNRLPQPYHPAFNVAAFAQASHDRFFLCIEAVDPKFDPVQTHAFLENLRPAALHEVIE